MSTRKVVRIDTGDTCFQTDPCQHECILYYDNGSYEKKEMYGDEMIHLYRNVLEPWDLEHFSELDESEEQQE